MANKGYKSNRISGKLRVYRYLKLNNSINNMLPHTTSFNLTNLKRMTNRYSTLYIKPDYGSQGKGIYKVASVPEGFKIKSTRSQEESFQEVEQVYQYIRKNSSSKLIIQQAIDLETINDRTYDLRTMIQRKPHGKWTITGTFGKIGKENKIVNNYFQGGKIIMPGKLFSQLNLTSEQTAARLNQLSRASYQVARSLSSRRSGMYEMGIDFAYDKQGQLWILEVNTRHPQFYPIRRIAPKMFQRMMTFARSIGRRNA